MVHSFGGHCPSWCGRQGRAAVGRSLPLRPSILADQEARCERGSRSRNNPFQVPVLLSYFRQPGPPPAKATQRLRTAPPAGKHDLIVQRSSKNFLNLTGACCSVVQLTSKREPMRISLDLNTDVEKLKCNCFSFVRCLQCGISGNESVI